MNIHIEYNHLIKTHITFMESLKVYKLESKKYVCANDIRDEVLPKFMDKAKKKTPRWLAEEFDIKKEEHIYATMDDGELKQRMSSMTKARLFVTLSWTKENLPKEDLDYKEWVANGRCEKKKDNSDEDSDNDSDNDSGEDNNNDNKKSKKKSNPVEEQYPLIDLSIKERFKAEHKSFIDIEIRGKREVNECYFKVKDVEKAFNIDRLRHHMTDQRKEGHTSGYKLDKDYKYLEINDGGNRQEKNSEIYLTYLGLLRVLITTKNGKTEPFIQWATNVLFTAHLGTPKQKRKLASELLDVNYTVLNSVLSRTNDKLSCIYLFKIGTVKQLRKDLKISKDIGDDNIVCKYGRTDDLNRRAREHRTAYSFSNNEPEMLLFALIDNKFNSKAERDVKEYFKKRGEKLTNDAHTELIYISDSDVKDIKKGYADIQKPYVGKHKDLVDQINHSQDIMMEKNKMIDTLKGQLEDKDEDMKEMKISHEKQLKANDKTIENLEKMLKMTEEKNEELKKKVKKLTQKK